MKLAVRDKKQSGNQQAEAGICICKDSSIYCRILHNIKELYSPRRIFYSRGR